jgi:hypothetical protein
MAKGGQSVPSQAVGDHATTTGALRTEGVHIEAELAIFGIVNLQGIYLYPIYVHIYIYKW